MLPEIRQWLEEIDRLRSRLQAEEAEIERILAEGSDAGGPIVDRHVSGLSGIKDVLSRFQKREIQIKDLDRGLVDFPAFIGGKEVFLCWEKDEEDIEFWHDLTAGYDGREPI